MKMMRILLFSLSITYFSNLPIFSLSEDSSKTIYELYHGESYKVVALFDKVFYQCSLEGNCNFVVKDTKKNSFKKYSHEADLPQITKTLIIFKKRSVNFKKKIGKYLNDISSTDIQWNNFKFALTRKDFTTK